MTAAASERGPRRAVGRMRPAEREQVAALFATALAEMGDAHPTTERPTDRAALRQTVEARLAALASDPTGVVLTARRADAVEGALAACQRRNAFDRLEWRLEGLAVDPTARRRGAGRALLAALCARARREGADYVTVEAAATDAALVNLLRNDGFFTAAYAMLLRLRPTKPERAKAEARQRRKA